MAKKDDITKDKDVKKILAEIDSQINDKKDEMLKEFTEKIDEQIEIGVQRKFDQLEKKIVKGKNRKILRRDILIVILLAVSIYLAYCLYEIGYFNKNLGDQNNISISQNNTENTVEPEKEVLPASYYIEKYSYLIENMQIPNNYEIFKNGVSKESMPNDVKLKIAYKNLSDEDKTDNGTVISVADEKILNAYQNIVGENELVEYANFDYENLNFLYFNNTFIAGKAEAVTNSVINYQITNAYENNNILTFDVKYEGFEEVFKYSFKKNNNIYYFDKIEK